MAKDINGFVESAKENGGYYISRYEAGDSITELDRSSTSSQETIPVFKKNQTAYNYITQPNAAILMRNLYSNQSYTSDLINSYAWDTAIVFIQKCSGDADYSRQSHLQGSLAKTGMATDGTNKDVRCNIYDMAGNLNELTTETSNGAGRPFVDRGGFYGNNSTNPAFRGSCILEHCSDSLAFRRNFVYII